jgi:uncharacterized surface protein with fasciclin (FAS1) repeats
MRTAPLPLSAVVLATLGLFAASLVGSSSLSAAPCPNSGRSTVRHGTVQPSHVVQPAVIHERIVSTHVREVALAQAPQDIVDVAVGAGTFKTLAAALGAADLVATLKSDGPFTVFAPTDDAFAKLPAGTVETLLKPENKDKLKEILLLHVVPGSVMAADVVKLKEAKTAGGKTLAISTADGVKVGTATGMSKVVKTDIKAKNGVIHVIDTVILP